MFVFRRKLIVEWGDCDPAGIVFYPRYFAMFDTSTALMFAAAGFSQQELQRGTSFVGWPMVDTRAKFYIPSAYGDEVEVVSRVTAWRRSSFDLEHQIRRGSEIAVEGFETRVWTYRHEHDPKRLKSQPVPAEVIARFSQP